MSRQPRSLADRNKTPQPASSHRRRPGFETVPGSLSEGTFVPHVPRSELSSAYPTSSGVPSFYRTDVVSQHSQPVVWPYGLEWQASPTHTAELQPSSAPKHNVPHNAAISARSGPNSDQTPHAYNTPIYDWTYAASTAGTSSTVTSVPSYHVDSRFDRSKTPTQAYPFGSGKRVYTSPFHRLIISDIGETAVTRSGIVSRNPTSSEQVPVSVGSMFASEGTSPTLSQLHESKRDEEVRRRKEHKVAISRLRNVLPLALQDAKTESQVVGNGMVLAFARDIG
jgi:hypothetical protein